MLRNKWFFIIFIILNLYLNHLSTLGYLFVLILIANIVNGDGIGKKMKKILFLMGFYLIGTLFQIFLYPHGHVLYKIFSIYITREGVELFLINYIRIINLIFLSQLIKYNEKSVNRLYGYENIVKIVVFLIPEVMLLFKKRIKLKWFIRHIMKEIKKIKTTENL